MPSPGLFRICSCSTHGKMTYKGQKLKYDAIKEFKFTSYPRLVKNRSKRFKTANCSEGLLQILKHGIMFKHIVPETV